MYLKVTGNTLDNVISSAHSTNSTKIIAKSTHGDASKGVDFYKLIDKKDFTGIKLLIIDEAFAIPRAALDRLFKNVAVYNKSVEAKDRVNI